MRKRLSDWTDSDLDLLEGLLNQSIQTYGALDVFGYARQAVRTLKAQKKQGATVDPVDRLVATSFGVGGHCACDGALDFGCPLCTPSQEEGFRKELAELVERYR